MISQIRGSASLVAYHVTFGAELFQPSLGHTNGDGFVERVVMIDSTYKFEQHLCIQIVLV